MRHHRRDLDWHGSVGTMRPPIEGNQIVPLAVVSDKRAPLSRTCQPSSRAGLPRISENHGPFMSGCSSPRRRACRSPFSTSSMPPFRRPFSGRRSRRSRRTGTGGSFSQLDAGADQGRHAQGVLRHGARPSRSSTSRPSRRLHPLPMGEVTPSSACLPHRQFHGRSIDHEVAGALMVDGPGDP